MAKTAFKVAAVIAALCSDLNAISAQELRWSRLLPIPDREGFAFPFAGISNGALLVAGGANFPGKKPWEGGTKRWYDTVYILERPDGDWKIAGKLPRPIGYGVSITTADGILCLGGSDQDRHYADCFQMQWNGREPMFKTLPALPKPCANSCGALVNNVVYVAGGIDNPNATKALKTFWALDLNDTSDGWHALETWPGSERMLATAGALDGSFYLCSGTALAVDTDGKPVRRWLRDAYRYSPGRGWTKLADLPRVAVAAPTPALQLGSSKLLIIGGDDGSQVSTPPTEHRGFPRDILGYDTTTDVWTTLASVPFSLVTTPAVNWNGNIIIPGGETRPGIRSPDVYSGQIAP
jgi:N-acetylneuraminate epimerase